jgi:hypothetical protein
MEINSSASFSLTVRVELEHKAARQFKKMPETLGG